MKCRLLGILCIIFPFTHSIAGVFGPSNYEECVADIVKSAKNSNYSVAQSVCRNQFPKLQKLAKKRNVTLSCPDVLGKWVYEITVKDGKVTVVPMSKVAMETTSFTKEGITFKGSSSDKNDKREVVIYGKINSITSEGNLTVEYIDKKTNDYVYEFTCSEAD